MKKIKSNELKFFENLLIQGGYVLDFNNADFRQYILDVTGIDVYDNNYIYKVEETMNSSSKGNILKYFLHNESDIHIITLLKELIEYVKLLDYDKYNINKNQLTKAKSILEKYEYTEYIIKSGSNEEKIDKLIEDINQSIADEKPEFTLDRLHTLIHNYMRELCDKYNIVYEKKDGINQLMKRYNKIINEKFESKLTKTILSQTASIFSEYNKVRNNQSYAHDNDILNKAESLLIYRNIVNIYEFIKTIEKEV